MSDVVVLTVTNGVRLAVCDGMIYPLTPCCGASGKGSGYGVVCRKCYQGVCYCFGTCVVVGDVNAEQDLANMIQEVGHDTFPITWEAAVLAASTMLDLMGHTRPVARKSAHTARHQAGRRARTLQGTVRMTATERKWLRSARGHMVKV